MESKSHIMRRMLGLTRKPKWMPRWLHRWRELRKWRSMGFEGAVEYYEMSKWVEFNPTALGMPYLATGNDPDDSAGAAHTKHILKPRPWPTNTQDTDNTPNNVSEGDEAQ